MCSCKGSLLVLRAAAASVLSSSGFLNTEPRLCDFTRQVDCAEGGEGMQPPPSTKWDRAGETPDPAPLLRDHPRARGHLAGDRETLCSDLRPHSPPGAAPP